MSKCKHPQEYVITYDDFSVLCEKCNCIIEQPGGVGLNEDVSKQPLCYAIVDNDGKMYFEEICVCEDDGPMKDICNEMNQDEPERKYKVVGLVAC